MKKSRSDKVLHLVKNWIRAIRYLLFRKSEYVGSRGWYFQLTGMGVTTTYIQHIQLAIELTQPIGKRGVNRQCLGLDPPAPAFHDGSLRDLFVSSSVVNHFHRKMVLITTTIEVFID